MHPGLIKLCSLREVEHAQWAVDSDADLFGLIFAPARRQISVERAKEIVEAASIAAGAIGPFGVGVFVDHDVAKLNNIVEERDLALVQLHGGETPEYIDRVRTPAIKAIRPMPEETFDDIASRIDSYSLTRRPPVGYLIEGFHPLHAGGQGVLADWELARKLAERFPIILAGGLTPDNVASAIEAVRPYGVDVSSGVERDGVKDRDKMIDFVARARAAFLRVNG